MRSFQPPLFSFEGRIGRKQYWIGTLAYFLGGILGAVLLVTLAALNYRAALVSSLNGLRLAKALKKAGYNDLREERHG